MVTCTNISNLLTGLLFCLLLVSCSIDVTPVTGEIEPVPTEHVKTEVKKPHLKVNTRDMVQNVYLSQVGVREATGNNDGVAVERYLKNLGLDKGYAWCAAFVRWCYDQAGVKTTITAWSPTAQNNDAVVYEKGKWKAKADKADVFTLFYKGINRIGHTGFVDKVYNDNSMIQTVEGNTNGQGSREGDGVYLKFRPSKTIHTITSWIR